MRNTIILLIIAAALGAYVYFYEIKGEEKRKEQEQYEKQLMHFEQDSVTAIEIKSAGGDFVMQKSRDGWRIEEPVSTGADNAPINSLLRSLSGAEKKRTFHITPEELTRYGLGMGALKVKLTMNDGSSDSLFFGAKSSVGNNIYVNKLDTLVYMTSANIKNNAEKSLFDWRDKKTVHFDKNRIRTFTLTNPQGQFTFVKEDGEWKLSQPIETNADPSKVDAVLNKLANGSIKSVESERAGNNLARFGLHRPAYRIDLYAGKEKAKSSVAFSKLSENRSYGKDAVRPHVFTVDSNYIDPLDKSLYDFRDRSIVAFDKNRADRINLLYDGMLVRLQKDTSGSWFTEDSVKAKSWKVNSVLNTLKNLKAERFVKEDPRYLMPFGLVNPGGKIEVFASDNKLAELNIGNQEGDFVYVQNPARKPVVTIRKSKLDQLFPKEDQLLEQPETNQEATEE